LNEIGGLFVFLRHRASPLFAASRLAPMVRALVSTPALKTVKQSIEPGAQVAI